MINDHQARRPFEPTTLDPHDILILDAVATLERTNPAAAGTVLNVLMRDFWSGKVKLYRLRRPDDTHYELGPDDIRQYSDDEDGVGSLTLGRIYVPFDRAFLLAGLRNLFNAGLVGGFGSEFDGLPESKTWEQAAARDPDVYDPNSVFLELLRIRLEELLPWASRMKLSRPDPWPTKGELQNRMTADRPQRRGRPSPISLVQEELLKRKEDGCRWPTARLAAEELANWLKGQVPERLWLEPKTILNRLGKEIPTAQNPRKS